MHVEPVEITSPQTRSPFALLIVVIAMCGLHIASADQQRPGVWVLLIVLVAVTVALFCFRNSPRRRLVLDIEGFGFAGGLKRGAPSKTMWRDVESFSVMELPAPRYGDQWKVVAIKFRPGAKKTGSFASSVNNVLGADACIPMIWPRPHETIVDELSEYRRKALEAQMCDGKSSSAEA